MKNIALILASGNGSRFGADCPKQFVEVAGKTILEHTVLKFQNNSMIDEIILVTNQEYLNKVKDLMKNFSKVKKVISGGVTRKDSSYNGISMIDEEECNVLIHDGVRPLVCDEIINSCVHSLNKKKAVCVAIDTTDTIFETDEVGVIRKIPKRKTLKRAQTPQCFKLSLIKKAHELAQNDPTCMVTDDCGLIMHYNLADIYTIEGSEENIKVTFSDDIEFIKNRLLS